MLFITHNYDPHLINYERCLIPSNETQTGGDKKR